jgi:threonine/homoserine/homoserine lactone efflux protein
MGMDLLFKGLIIGISIAAPVGPIGILCIRRTLAEGRLVGLASGLGAATADAIYGSVAGFGLTFLSGFLVEQQLWLRLVGGVFLCFLGVRALVSGVSGEVDVSEGLGALAAYGSTFFLTLTNPVTIISFAAVFAGLGLGTSGGDYLSAVLLVLGVFAGSAVWWFILSGLAGVLRGKATPQVLRWINRVSGAVIVGFGVYALVSVWFLG